MRAYRGMAALAGMCLAAGAASVPGLGAERHMLTLTARSREGIPADGYAVREKKLHWHGAQTAVIVCDLWDRHWCRGATARVEEMAPRIDQFLKAARQRGMLIVHAPSSCMEFYQEHPARRRALEAPAAANLPTEIERWCNRIPAEDKGEYPIDQSDGGCDDTPRCEGGSPWKRQIAAIRVLDEDAVSDSGSEIWNLFEQRGIRNVLLLGVHTNMCVLGRPFGLRNLARFGKNVALVRDLTDTMYNSRARPYVNHFRGTDLIVEHVEKFVAPTVTSDQLLGGRPFRFRDDRDRR
jgi:nicotinamidase-related amidase